MSFGRRLLRQIRYGREQVNRPSLIFPRETKVFQSLKIHSLQLACFFFFLTISLQDLHKDVEIKAANGKALRAVTVFAHALKFFKDHVLEELSDQSATKILEEDIQWVLTVPAIWKAPAKQFMRTAAYEVSRLYVSYFRMHISSVVYDWLKCLR